MLIHFYSPIDLKTIKKIDEWDIEKEYYKYGHGVGHAIFEFYKRLKNVQKCTIGANIPKNSDIVIIFSKHFNSHSDYLKLKKLNCTVIQILSDENPRNIFFVKNLLKISPYDFYSKTIKKDFKNIDQIYKCKKNNYKFIPLFVQRGLLIREIAFSKNKLNLGFNGNVQNIPKFLNKKKISSLGFNLIINSTSQNWNDYKKIHLSFCGGGQYDKIEKYIKPTTKVLNAISANVIPITNDHLSYKTIIKNNINGFICNDEESFFRVLRYINKHKSILKKINKTNSKIRENYNNQTILELWITLFKQKNKKIKISNLIYILILFENIKKLIRKFLIF